MDIEGVLNSILKRLTRLEEQREQDKEDIMEELRNVQESLSNISLPGRDYDIFSESD